MKKYLSTFMMLVAAAIWGFAFSAQKAAAHVPAFTLVFARSLLGAIFLFFLIMVLDRALKTGRRLVSKRGLDFNKTELIGGTLCGIVLSLASVLQQSGIGSGTDAGKAAFITALYVVLVPVFSLVLKKRAPINAWISVAIAVVGFYLLCIKGDFSLEFSDALVLLCAVVFTTHILVIDRFSPRCDGVRMSCVQFAVVTVVSLVCAIFFEQPVSLDGITSAIGPILMLGIGSSGIAYTLQIVAQSNLNPTVASIVMSLESVFGVIGSALLLGETMSTREYFGCAIVFTAVVLSQLDFSSLKKHKAAK
ncbi:MAG: DMT family transporter [Clostridia bacterium]|nr:DMT family transporter [Clostridia bacterium]